MGYGAQLALENEIAEDELKWYEEHERLANDPT